MRNSDRTIWLSQTDRQKWDSSHQETFFQSSTVKFGDPVQIAALVSWCGILLLWPVWFKVSTCCMFRDAIPKTLTGYLSYCYLPVIFNQSASFSSPEPWHQQGIVLNSTILVFFVITFFLSLFATPLCKPKKQLQENPSSLAIIQGWWLSKHSWWHWNYSWKWK